MTQEGLSYPLGTRFSVQQHTDSTQVAVYEGRVALERRGCDERTTLDAGQQADMSADEVSTPEPLEPAGGPLSGAAGGRACGLLTWSKY